MTSYCTHTNTPESTTTCSCVYVFPAVCTECISVLVCTSYMSVRLFRLGTRKDLRVGFTRALPASTRCSRVKRDVIVSQLQVSVSVKVFVYLKDPVCCLVQMLPHLARKPNFLKINDDSQFSGTTYSQLATQYKTRILSLQNKIFRSSAVLHV